MATDQNVQERRRHQYRGRRGPDRRATDHRVPNAAAGDRSGADVDQIMREVRARIAQRHGVELSPDQVHELAARRLDALLDPRDLPPALLDQLRRSASTPAPLPDTASTPEPAFDEAALYEAPGGWLRTLRRLLHPVLKLFMNPAALAGSLRAQAQLTRDLAAREAARERRQAEWNALHYEILQRLVTEIARVSLDMQSLSMRVESLGAKVDFNERRVRSLESTAPGAGPRSPRAAEPPIAVGPVAVDDGGAAAALDPGAEGVSRKRRRRRSRRGGRTGTERPLPAGVTEPAEDEILEGSDDGGTGEAVFEGDEAGDRTPDPIEPSGRSAGAADWDAPPAEMPAGPAADDGQPAGPEPTTQPDGEPRDR